MADTVKTPVSPKVKWGAIWAALAGIGAAAVTAGAGALDPHLFDQLGLFGPIVYTAIVTGAGTLAAYLTKDALREAGQEGLNAAAAQQAQLGVGVTNVAPVAPPVAEQPAPVVDGSPSPEVPNAGTFAAPAATESTIQS